MAAIDRKLLAHDAVLRDVYRKLLPWILRFLFRSRRYLVKG
jgi:hypothetical protein